ncbi:MAG: hypothetical protein RL662_670 [Bacteroidota bacterium]|jgi:vitamin B12 transporter
MKPKKTVGLAILSLLLATNSTAQESTKAVELTEITITASRMELPLKNIPQKVELISQSVINAIPSQNLGDILKRTTNVDVIQYPGGLSAVGMRGFPATNHVRGYTLILIDGKPAGTNNLATIPSEFIERIEVVKGPYAVLYGTDAMGGIINIITQAASNKPLGKVAFSVGNFGQTNIMAYASGAISPKLLFSMGYTRTEQSGDYRIGGSNFTKLTETEKNILDKKSYGDVMTNSQYQINQFNAKLAYTINTHWQANLLSLLTVSNDIESPGNYWHSYGLSKKDVSRFANYLDLTYTRTHNVLRISPYFSIQKDAGYNNNTDSAFINSKEQVKQYGIKLDNTHTWGNLKWLSGADYDGYWVGSERFSSKITPTNPYRPNHLRNSISGFTQLAYTTDKLSLNGGVRYNYIRYTLQSNPILNNAKSSANYSNLNPSLAVRYRFSSHLNGHASLGTAFYAPDAYKTAGVYVVGNKQYVGNKDLKPETSFSYELGLGYGIDDRLNGDVTYFQNYYKNKIVNDNSRIDTASYKNATKSMMNGLEIRISSNIAHFWDASYSLELYGGLTYFFNNRFEEESKDELGVQATITRDVLYTRKATANFGVSFRNQAGFEARLSGRYIGHRLENDWMSWDDLRPDIKATDYYDKGGYTAQDQILRHSAHVVFDLSSHYTINQKFRVGVSISNMLDENYSEKDGYNMPGRSTMGHFSYQF